MEWQFFPRTDGYDRVVQKSSDARFINDVLTAEANRTWRHRLCGWIICPIVSHQDAGVDVQRSMLSRLYCRFTFCPRCRLRIIVRDHS